MPISMTTPALSPTMEDGNVESGRTEGISVWCVKWQ